MRNQQNDLMLLQTPGVVLRVGNGSTCQIACDDDFVKTEVCRSLAREPGAYRKIFLDAVGEHSCLEAFTSRRSGFLAEHLIEYSCPLPVLFANGLCSEFIVDVRIDLDRLASAVTRLHSKHPVLDGSLFEHMDASWIVFGQADEALTRPTIRYDEPQDRDLSATEIAFAPFDLTSETPLRVVVTPYAGGSRIVIVLHHAFGDALSLRLIQAELWSLYIGGPENDPPTLPRTNEFLRFYLEQRKWRGSTEGLRSLGAILKASAKAGTPRGLCSTPTGRLASASYRVTREGLERVSDLVRGLGLTTSLFFLALHAYLDATLRGDDRYFIRCSIDTRGIPEYRNAVGPFFGYLFLAGHLDQSGDTSGFMREVARTFWRNYSRRQIPYENVAAFAGQRHLTRCALFNFIDAKNGENSGYARKHGPRRLLSIQRPVLPIKEWSPEVSMIVHMRGGECILIFRADEATGDRVTSAMSLAKEFLERYGIGVVPF